ncbi:hypothetical protein R4Y45_06365 [Holzapfeliella sp. He02]|uniref:Tim44-like domain-containing protein n=1 Tax=Holzapfeliella saturejae TaxID=3082953 RepID=A0ABU8SHZ9_9LACO
MKKLTWLLLIISSLFLLLTIQSTPVSARVGGGSGGGGSHTSTSSNNDDYDSRSFLGYTKVGPYTFNNDSTALGGLLVIAFFSQKITRKRWLKKKGQAIELDPQLEKHVTELFYEVEEAWDKKDKKTLASCLTKRYYFNQWRLIMRWQLLGKINHVDNINLIEVKQFKTKKPTQLKLLITGQARDWFENRYQSKDKNELQAENAQIERFTEIWHVINTSNGLKIKQIIPVDD